jgi:hypothetical protein
MFKGDSADTGAGKFPLVSMGGLAEGLACADPGERTPIGASGIVYLLLILYQSRQPRKQSNFNKNFFGELTLHYSKYGSWGNKDLKFLQMEDVE